MKEIYKSIKGFENYLVSNYGNIYSIKSDIILKQRKSSCGYLTIVLCENSVKNDLRIHRLVATAFIPNPNNKPDVNHKDGNKENNYTDNLEWVTQSENEIHAYKTGLKNQKGERNGNCKLTNLEVLQVRGLYLGGIKQRSIAKIFGVSYSLISLILSGKLRNY